MRIGQVAKGHYNGLTLPTHSTYPPPMSKQGHSFDFSATDTCVKCGLCLPHCPTYRVTQSENESPRGRLALIDGWSRGQLKETTALTGHLDRCLMCRACESVCPAEVPYAEIVDAFRLQQTAPHKPSLPERLLLNRNRSAIHRFLKLYQRLGIQAFLRFTGLNRVFRQQRLDNLLPAALGKTFKTRHIARHTDKPAVSLFTGCATEILDPKTLTDSIHLLEHCGYRVHAPAHQPCCGALDLHAGRLDAARSQQDLIPNTFNTSDDHPIVSVASGCGATLQEHPNTDFSQRTLDISTLLSRHQEHLEFHPLEATALLHTPCTLKNVMQQHAAPAQLLQHIPGLKLSLLSSGSGCCGAAGTYMLNQPDMSQALRQPLIEALTDNPPDYLLTSNIGCALHLQAGLREAGLATQALHPVSLLAQQLIES